MVKATAKMDLNLQNLSLSHVQVPVSFTVTILKSHIKSQFLKIIKSKLKNKNYKLQSNN
jgi:hypothetical protein